MLRAAALGRMRACRTDVAFRALDSSNVASSHNLTGVRRWTSPWACTEPSRTTLPLPLPHVAGHAYSQHAGAVGDSGAEQLQQNASRISSEEVADVLCRTEDVEARLARDEPPTELRSTEVDGLRTGMGSPDPVDPAPTRFSVVTYNTWSVGRSLSQGADLGWVVDKLAATGADFLCLQECNWDSWEQDLEMLLACGYGVTTGDMAADDANDDDELGDERGLDAEDGGVLAANQVRFRKLILYRKDKFRELASFRGSASVCGAFAWKGVEDEVPAAARAAWDTIAATSPQEVQWYTERLTEKLSIEQHEQLSMSAPFGGPIYIANLHLKAHARLFANQQTAQLTESLRRLNLWLVSQCSNVQYVEEAPVIVCGDFNFPLDNFPSLPTSSFDLANIYERMYGRHPRTFSWKAVKSCLDSIYYTRPALQCVSAALPGLTHEAAGSNRKKVTRENPSDHLPVAAVFELQRFFNRNVVLSEKLHAATPPEVASQWAWSSKERAYLQSALEGQGHGPNASVMDHWSTVCEMLDRTDQRQRQYEALYRESLSARKQREQAKQMRQEMKAKARAEIEARPWRALLSLREVRRMMSSAKHRFSPGAIARSCLRYINKTPTLKKAWAWGTAPDEQHEQSSSKVARVVRGLIKRVDKRATDAMKKSSRAEKRRAKKMKKGLQQQRARHGLSSLWSAMKAYVLPSGDKPGEEEPQRDRRLEHQRSYLQKREHQREHQHEHQLEHQREREHQSERRRQRQRQLEHQLDTLQEGEGVHQQKKANLIQQRPQDHPESRSGQCEPPHLPPTLTLEEEWASILDAEEGHVELPQLLRTDLDQDGARSGEVSKWQKVEWERARAAREADGASVLSNSNSNNDEEGVRAKSERKKRRAAQARYHSQQAQLKRQAERERRNRASQARRNSEARKQMAKKQIEDIFKTDH